MWHRVSLLRTVVSQERVCLVIVNSFRIVVQSVSQLLTFFFARVFFYLEDGCDTFTDKGNSA